MSVRPECRHRPTDPRLLKREAEALLALGLSVPDAAQAIGVPARQLLGWLSEDTVEQGTECLTT